MLCPLVPAVPAVQLDLQDVTIVGASMGCAVVWSYMELFGEERLKKVGGPVAPGHVLLLGSTGWGSALMALAPAPHRHTPQAVFVDQAPLQNNAPDW